MGPFLESIRDSCAGLFDDCSLDPGNALPLSFLTVPFSLSYHFFVENWWYFQDRIQETYDLHGVHKNHQCLALPSEGVQSTFSVAPYSATTYCFSLENFFRNRFGTCLYHTNSKRNKSNFLGGSLKTPSNGWLTCEDIHTRKQSKKLTIPSVIKNFLEQLEVSYNGGRNTSLENLWQHLLKVAWQL